MQCLSKYGWSIISCLCFWYDSALFSNFMFLSFFYCFMFPWIHVFRFMISNNLCHCISISVTEHYEIKGVSSLFLVCMYIDHFQIIPLDEQQLRFSFYDSLNHSLIWNKGRLNLCFGVYVLGPFSNSSASCPATILLITVSVSHWCDM